MSAGVPPREEVKSGRRVDSSTGRSISNNLPSIVQVRLRSRLRHNPDLLVIPANRIRREKRKLHIGLVLANIFEVDLGLEQT